MSSSIIAYSLDDLFVHQDSDWVTDTIAPVLAWVSAKSRGKPPYRFEVEHKAPRKYRVVHIDLSWDDARLERIVPGVLAHADRLRTRRSPQREHVAELAGYGLALVAISTLMPGRRIVSMQFGAAPDLLFDLTPGKLKGVEVAARTTGGRGALKDVRDGSASKRGKAAPLMKRGDLAEVHLSLCCASPRTSMMEQLKP